MWRAVASPADSQAACLAAMLVKMSATWRGVLVILPRSDRRPSLVVFTTKLRSRSRFGPPWRTTSPVAVRADDDGGRAKGVFGTPGRATHAS